MTIHKLDNGEIRVAVLLDETKNNNQILQMFIDKGYKITKDIAKDSIMDSFTLDDYIKLIDANI